MSSIMAIAGSGMRAAQQGVQVAAHNVANLPTSQDPTAPVADLLAARTEVLAFKANAMVLRRADEMLGTLFDQRA